MASMPGREMLCSSAALSAASLFASAVNKAEALFKACNGTGLAESLAAVAPCEQLLFDFGWKFARGHASDPERDFASLARRAGSI